MVMVWRAMMFLAAAVAVAAPARAGDVAAGKAKVQICAPCHGADGVSHMPNAPSLAAEPDQYLQWQMVYFRAGARQNPLMSPVAAKLSDGDIQDLGAYFASLPPPKPESGKLDPDLMAAAVTVIAKNRCASCHKSNFSGNGMAARLASQREEYLVKSLESFKSGVRRGSGAAGAMSSIAFGMTAAEIKAVSYYLAHHP
jgi:cytochrome c553